MKNLIIYSIVMLLFGSAVPARSADKIILKYNGREIGDAAKSLEAFRDGSLEKIVKEITIYRMLLDMTSIDHNIHETINKYKDISPENTHIFDEMYKECISMGDLTVDFMPLVYHMALKPIAEKEATRWDAGNIKLFDEEKYNSIVGEEPRDLMILYSNMQKLVVAKELLRKIYGKSHLFSHEEITNHDFMGTGSIPDPLYNVMKTNFFIYSKDEENYIYFGVKMDQHGMVEINMDSLQEWDRQLKTRKKIQKKFLVSDKEIAAVSTGGIIGGQIFFEVLSQLNTKTNGMFALSGTYAEMLHNSGARLNGEEIVTENYQQFLSQVSQNYRRVLVLESKVAKEQIEKIRRKNLSFVQKIISRFKN